jgi:mono/diheme cytochrome c family protein
VKAPPKGPTAEYGSYLASSVYDCVQCHSPGLEASEVKVKAPAGYTGGMEFDLTSSGVPGVVYSPNITPHETQGIGKWNLEQFKVALREGVTPDHYILRKPMPRLREVDDVELEAMFTFLKTLPAKDTAKFDKTPLERPKADAAAATPDKLFSSLGCTYCHGPKGQFRDRLKNALSKQPEDVAKWIRNPESFKPGTQMPTFASLIDENQAMQLAKWVQEKKGEP